MTRPLHYGIYEALLDRDLKEALERHPELRSILGKIDFEEQPARYAAFVAAVIEQALRHETDPASRLAFCNRLIEQISGLPDRVHLGGKFLVNAAEQLLLEITPPNYGVQGVPRPSSSLTETSLFTGSPSEPQLAHELQAEMHSADSVDILVAFIKWSGLRLLMKAFEDLRMRDIPVRVITTAYMGASDATAVEWLASQPNVKVRVSYDTERTRLHAKAYHFKRLSGFSTAYIGSANMSHAAITSGLEWNLKVTSQDMAHILEKFAAEFETYWNSREFIPFDSDYPQRFRDAIQRARNAGAMPQATFFDLSPYPFQERILEALARERKVHDRWRNLVIAATGTGKTVIAAFDFKRFYELQNRQARLLFVAHRQEILEQSIATFRNVLRDGNLGDLWVGSYEPNRLDHLFCSVRMLVNSSLWKKVGSNFYDFIIIDEAHHGTADSYRPIFDHFSPRILLGLTATPERMDGKSVAADFSNRFAAEIRLPEALEEKLLCPFHYFGVADPIHLDLDRFWRNGRYDAGALENVYTGADILARQRVDAVQEALFRYEPELSKVKGIGFCVTMKHARYMAQMFNDRGIPSAALISDVEENDRAAMLSNFRAGNLVFLFTVDVLNEGLDVPEMNTVLFLRPTDSLTVFLQQLGRGLRHAPGKDCLTVLDFVGRAHRRYRIDSKLKALLPRHRFSIDREVEHDFPHLPAGCSIQFDRLSRQYVLENIRANLRNLAIQVPERLQTFENETGKRLSFGNFVIYHDYEPELLLVRETWTSWKAKARLTQYPTDPDLNRLKQGLVRAAFITGPREISLLRRAMEKLLVPDVLAAMEIVSDGAMLAHYRIWGVPGRKLGIRTLEDSFRRISENSSVLSDLIEILEWAGSETTVDGQVPVLPFPSLFELHAQYGSRDVQAVLGQATLETAGQTGVGLLHFPSVRAYALLITYQKTEREFSPSTMYADYPISRELLHWESQSNTAQQSDTGQNLIHHADRRYTILIFARDKKKTNGSAAPFVYLGPADRVTFESERPIKIVWRLRYPIPVEMYEKNRRGG
jgi:superfamily II DNA or RNA helicase/HKD family nuclease